MWESTSLTVFPGCSPAHSSWNSSAGYKSVLFPVTYFNVVSQGPGDAGSPWWNVPKHGSNTWRPRPSIQPSPALGVDLLARCLYLACCCFLCHGFSFILYFWFLVCPPLGFRARVVPWVSYTRWGHLFMSLSYSGSEGVSCLPFCTSICVFQTGVLASAAIIVQRREQSRIERGD